jgi:putative ABC transport system permease protein
VRVLLICFVISIPISIVLINIWLQNFVYKTPIYWWVFALALLLISVITLTTVTFQSFRSANDNPVDSLKNE